MDLRVNKKTIVAFDLDDTLYNEIDYLISAYKEIAKKVSQKNFLHLYSHMFSMYRNKLDVFRFISDKYKIDKAQLIDMYRAHMPKIRPSDGARKLLKDIKNNSGKIVIITDGRSQTQRNKINALGLTPLVDYISISEEIGASKPSIKPFELVEKNLEGEFFYYIADNVKKDFISPNKMNWNTICVLDSGRNIHSNAHLYQNMENQPDFYVNSLKEIKVV